MVSVYQIFYRLIIRLNFLSFQVFIRSDSVLSYNSKSFFLPTPKQGLSAVPLIQKKI